jgi:hypothetical protein
LKTGSGKARSEEYRDDSNDLEIVEEEEKGGEGGGD